MRGEAGRFDAIVIGAGVNGLVGSIVLARAGKKVLVLEQAAAAGGMGRVHEFAPGFRTAPLGLDAGWFSPRVVRATGIHPPARKIPDIPLACVGPSGGLPLPGDPAAAVPLIRKDSVRDAGRWPAFVELIHKLTGFVSLLYQLPPPDIDANRPADLMPMLGVARRLRQLGRRDMVELLRVVPMSVQELLEDWFESPLLKAAIGAVGVSGIRQGPRSGGTSFVLLHHQVGASRGSFGPAGPGFWDSGPDGLVRTLVSRAQSLGVEFRYGGKVSRLEISDERVTGAVLGNGDHYGAPLVLSTADPARTMLSMVDPVWLDPELLLAIRNIKFRGSSSRISYALGEMPRFPGVDQTLAPGGVISLTGSLDQLEKAADSAKYGAISTDPHITLRVLPPDWRFATPPRVVMVAEVQWTPFRLREGSWDAARRNQLSETVTAAIEQVSPGFRDRVIAAELLIPSDLEERYGLTEGAFSHGELMLDQILFMRPVPALSRYSTPIAGLYLGGSGSHPGPGMAGAAGWLAARAALNRR